MPLIVRYVEPEELHRTPLLQGVQPRENELERMCVASLTTLIRQLSSLAKHAESIMGDVADALAVYHARSRALEERVRRLKVDVIPSLSDEGIQEPWRWGGVGGGGGGGGGEESLCAYAWTTALRTLDTLLDAVGQRQVSPFGFLCSSVLLFALTTLIFFLCQCSRN